MIIVLIGYMGSGKSTIGKGLANVLSMNFLDLDSVIEAHEKSTINDIFEYRGEIYFRKKESELLRKVINEQDNLILSLGGGTPCYSQNMSFLSDIEKVRTLYLKSSINTLSERLYNEKEHRPIISHLTTRDELKEFIAKHLFERNAYYEQAQSVLNTDNLTIQETIEKIVLELF